MIEKMDQAHWSGISEVVHSLSDWFDENARKWVPVDLIYQQGFVHVEWDEVIGFVSYSLPEAEIFVSAEHGVFTAEKVIGKAGPPQNVSYINTHVF